MAPRKMNDEKGLWPNKDSRPLYSAACDAVKAAKIVVQIGTQSRSYPGMAGAKAIYETGVLGSISRIEQMRNGNRPYWYKRLARLPIAESELDWREFLKPGPYRPFNDLLFARVRLLGT